ncbi:MAG: L,D-transpeptidase family protein [Sphingorhabdus sp.]
MKYLWLLLPACLLAGCERNAREQERDVPRGEAKTETPSNESGLQFTVVADEAPPLDASLAMMQTQVVLEQLGFSPGVIDGKSGQSLTLALKGFQEANGLKTTGELDTETTEKLRQWQSVPATLMVRIPAEFAAGPFVPDFPAEAADQAKLPALGYRDLMEALSERFHTDPETLLAINSPETIVAAGQVIRVPNVADAGVPGPDFAVRGWDKTLQALAVSADQPDAEKVVVDKSDGVLRAFDANDKLIAQFPATMGSKHDPLPLGNWTIKGVSRNPDFHYNPKLFWDVNDSKEKLLLKPGPNGPVGVVWIDLSKPHYGIHGTNEPDTIGRAESHGCVRLTNWDAAKLAGMVKPGVKVVFQK